MENRNFIYGIAAVKFGGDTIGYIEKGSWDWGGQKPVMTDIEAEQVPEAPVLTLVDKDGLVSPTFNLIQLDYGNLQKVLGGRIVINRSDGMPSGWESPTKIVKLSGDWAIDFLSGQSIVIPCGTIAANLGGKLTLSEVSKVECQLTINKPSDGGSPYTVANTTLSAMVKAIYRGVVLKTFNSAEKGAKGAIFTDYVYYTRAVKFGDGYYTVPARTENMRNYGLQPSHYGDTVEVAYNWDPDIVYYAESEDLVFMEGSYRGEEMVPERASGGEWHRLSSSSAVRIPYLLTPGTYSIEIAGRNQGTSSARLEVYWVNANGSLGNVIGTPQWEDGENESKFISDYYISGGTGGYIALINGNFSSNVCIDYIIIRKNS